MLQRIKFIIPKIAMAWLAVPLALMMVLCEPGRASADPAVSPADANAVTKPGNQASAAFIMPLYEQLKGSNSHAELPPYDVMLVSVSRVDPNWPIISYLVAENYLKQEKLAQAATGFKALATWSVSKQAMNAYKDDWGVSGLASVALWRWLKTLQQQGALDEQIAEAIELTGKLQRSRFFSGMVQASLLPALPLMEEDIARLLAHAAWRTRREDAASLFLDYISINSSGKLDPFDEQIMQSMINNGLAVQERLELFRLRRQLYHIKIKARKEQTLIQLFDLWENAHAPDDVRAEAGYEWANHYRYSRSRKAQVIAVLNSAFALTKKRGVVAQKALYLRAKVQNSVSPKKPDAFVKDMNSLLELFPRSRLVDDVYFQLAGEYFLGDQQNIELALSNFQKLRLYQGSNDWLDSAYFLAAIAHMDRGNAEDFIDADKLLAEYVRLFPDGPFRLRCLFWRGRLAERANAPILAEAFFRQVIKEAPYNYYSLRAAMHLEKGSAAALMTLPEAGSKLSERIRTAYHQQAPDSGVKPASVYHIRLAAAADNKLYQELYSIVGGIGKEFRERLDNIDLQALDDKQLIPSVALLLAYRQDAAAARDSDPNPDNHLRLAELFGNQMGDWPTAISMTFLRNDAPYQQITSLQNDPRFLRAVYPDIERIAAIKQPLQKAAWAIDASQATSESLMYAVIRRESAFFSGAISPVGALGLFQVMPNTFNGRPGCWTMWQAESNPTPASYLFNPARNIQFWSCWVRKEFKPETAADIAEMLVKHHAGMGNLREWKNNWKGRIMENDLEMQIDTFRFPATQIFVRNVLTDMILINASGIFDRREIVRLEGSNE